METRRLKLLRARGVLRMLVKDRGLRAFERKWGCLGMGSGCWHGGCVLNWARTSEFMATLP